MTESAPSTPGLTRVPTGLDGLDRIIAGGLFRGGVYMLVGRPGTGKTTLATQICFHRASEGESVLYVTLLTEAHGRLLANLQTFAFFDASRIGREIHFVNGYKAIDEEGLEGLQRMLRHITRERQAKLLVIDGMVTVEALASSPVAYKKFIQELQTWCSLVGCTVLILTSANAGDPVGPEHTMVDGIFELSTRAADLRTVRQLFVTKFRGSGYLEGGHHYRITARGIEIFPRFELLYGRRAEPRPGDERVASGVPGLDELLDGGFAPASLTLVLGPSGSGKTLAGLHFLAEGARRGEQGLFFGFFETPPVLAVKARRFALPVGPDEVDGLVPVVWQPMAEALLDELGERILREVDRHRARRLFIDGLVAFEQATVDPERLGTFFAMLGEELRARGVTVLVSEETRELAQARFVVPITGISASFENLVLFDQVEQGADLVRLVAVVKTRDSTHATRVHAMQITSRGLALGKAAGVRAGRRKKSLAPPRGKGRRGSR